MATGMTLTLCLLALRKVRLAGAKYVIWSRIDQKSCFKSISCAGERQYSQFHSTKRYGDYRLARLWASRCGAPTRWWRAPHWPLRPLVCCRLPGRGRRRGHRRRHHHLLLCTQSLRRFARELTLKYVYYILSPRSAWTFFPLLFKAVAKLCRDRGIPHLINNAYGLQSSKCMHLVEEAGKAGGKWERMKGAERIVMYQQQQQQKSSFQIRRLCPEHWQESDGPSWGCHCCSLWQTVGQDHQ